LNRATRRSRCHLASSVRIRKRIINLPAVIVKRASDSRLANLKAELESGQRHPDHEKRYAQYVEVKTTPVRGTKIVAKKEAIAEAKRNHGYFALLSNEIKDPVEALSTYRNKDLVENKKWTGTEMATSFAQIYIVMSHMVTC